jgi:hypothetical protein
MTVDAVRLRRARRAIYGPPITGLLAAVFTLAGVYGLVTHHSPEAAAPAASPGMHLIAPTIDSNPGYVMVTADGRMFTNAAHGVQAVPALTHIVDAARRADGRYWLASADGHVWVSGTHTQHAIRMPAHAAPIVGIAAATHGPGYWLASADGHIYTVGALRLGTRVHSHTPIVGIAAAAGGGFWLAARDGHVYAFGTPLIGDLSRDNAHARIVGIAPGPFTGYWLAASDGRVFAFGAPPFAGVKGTAKAPIVGIASTVRGGYWLTTADGTVYALGGAPLKGSLSKSQARAPVVAITSR